MNFLFIILIFFGTSFNKENYAHDSVEPLIPRFSFSQQEPFYFTNSVPEKIKLFNSIDLSFFCNQLIVRLYRLRLEIPFGGETAIDRNLIKWSAWENINEGFTKIIIPELDQEGGYKFTIEYMTRAGNETKKFEKLFYVYRANPMAKAEISKPESVLSTEKTTTKSEPVSYMTSNKPIPVAKKTTVKTEPITNSTAKRKTPVINKITIKTTTIAILHNTDNTVPEDKWAKNNKIDLKEGIKEGNEDKAISLYEKKNSNPLSDRAAAGNSNNPDNRLISEAIEKKDAALFRKYIQNGSVNEIKGATGGNIFHLMNDVVANEELISILKNKGISINKTDNYGNSPLHFAILSGESEYARSLINQGTDLNMKNQMDLSPLHLAAFFNNEEIVNALLNKGAEINLKGNTGYTALHIASEMNHIEIARDLVIYGAKNSLKTDQKLTPKDIAKIQNNNDMGKLIGKKGSYALPTNGSILAKSNLPINSIKQKPNINFDLPYNQKFVKKRQFNKVIQWVSIPVFVVSAAGTTYFKTEANHYYSQYKNSQTEDVAKYNYDKTKQYDKYTYISGGVSLLSVYGIISSIIRNKNISNKMCRTYY